jgi:hypothetical protein
MMIHPVIVCADITASAAPLPRCVSALIASIADARAPARADSGPDYVDIIKIICIIFRIRC